MNMKRLIKTDCSERASKISQLTDICMYGVRTMTPMGFTCYHITNVYCQYSEEAYNISIGQIIASLKTARTKPMQSSCHNVAIQM